MWGLNGCSCLEGHREDVYPRFPSDGRGGNTRSPAAFTVAMESWGHHAGWGEPKTPSRPSDRCHIQLVASVLSETHEMKQPLLVLADSTSAHRTDHLSITAIGTESQKSAFSWDVLRKDPRGTFVCL